MTTRFAYFITPHGFGHASRASAIMQAFNHIYPDVCFDIFTQAPEWFFKDSLTVPFNYHTLQSDVGLIQKSSMTEDLPATLNVLQHFFSDWENKSSRLADLLKSRNCQAVFCDISPLGIAAAVKAGLPSFFLENFTWDWIYESYLDSYPQFEPYIALFKQIYAKPSFYIQMNPVCVPVQRANLLSHPVSRAARTSRADIRQSLQIADGKKSVLVTMGGIPTRFRFLEQLKNRPDVVFVVPGAGDSISFEDNLRILPHQSHYYHPDLVNAVDGVIAKAGYSTISEVYRAGISFGYILRENFRETEPLRQYLRSTLSGVEFKGGDFESGNWKTLLDVLLEKPRVERTNQDGAEQIAAFIKNKLQLVN